MDKTAPPRRIQLSRAKGWRMPPNTVKVDRSTGYGNPFTIAPGLKPGTRVGGLRAYFAVESAEEAVLAFREMMAMPGETADAYRALLPRLRGKSLACWCKPGAPCHADVLLELANATLQAAQPQTMPGEPKADTGHTLAGSGRSNPEGAE